MSTLDRYPPLECKGKCVTTVVMRLHYCEWQTFGVNVTEWNCKKIDPGTHSMDRGGDVYVDPDPRPVKAKVRANEKACTGALSILPILKHTNGTAFQPNST